ncbi:MAG TPA: hypothetical protein VGN42_09730 [Pirellulales bacterium]|jgi:hypothetical protein|nr:hypothetical protein [Pirellulales bacterium]
MTNEAELAGLTEVQRKLFEAVCPAHPLEEIKTPPWEVQVSWASFVPEEIAEVWEKLPIEAQILAYAIARDAKEAPDYSEMWDKSAEI